jgi:hypothetical protein
MLRTQLLASADYELQTLVKEVGKCWTAGVWEVDGKITGETEFTVQPPTLVAVS